MVQGLLGDEFVLDEFESSSEILGSFLDVDHSIEHQLYKGLMVMDLAKSGHGVVCDSVVTECMETGQLLGLV